MPSPYGLEMVESCSACRLNEGRLFCDLSPEALAALNSLKFTAAYPKGALLFVEGQPARGVFILCAGRVKLLTSSGDARVIITSIVEPGELLGLSAAVSDTPYEVTAETLSPCQVSFIRREDFSRFLAQHAEACLRVAQQLSLNYRRAFEQVRLLGLSQSAAGKLARFILEACDRHGKKVERVWTLKMTLTHEEIGQLIGASRETVTRLFSDFKSAQLIEVRGATFNVPDRAPLEAMAVS